MKTIKGILELELTAFCSHCSHRLTLKDIGLKPESTALIWAADIVIECPSCHNKVLLKKQDLLTKWN